MRTELLANRWGLQAALWRIRIMNWNERNWTKRVLMVGFTWRTRIARVGRLVMLGGVCSLMGCSAYQGAILETTSTDMKRIEGPGQKGVAAAVRDGMLVVERFDLREVETVPVVTTRQTYSQCWYKPPVMEFKTPRGEPRLASDEELLSFWFSYFIDMIDSDSICSRPVVPILSRVVCAALPLVSCSGTPGPVVMDTSTAEGASTTAPERRPLAGSIQVEIAGKREDVQVDSTGIAHVPLEQVAVAGLRRGVDRLSVRVAVRE